MLEDVVTSYFGKPSLRRSIGSDVFLGIEKIKSSRSES